jgi:hypothetical protein
MKNRKRRADSRRYQCPRSKFTCSFDKGFIKLKSCIFQFVQIYPLSSLDI